MSPYYQDESVTLYHGDCRDVLPELGKVDHMITDPPYARDVYLRASAGYSKLGSGTPKRMGLSEKTRRGGALQKMANGDIGIMDKALIEVFQAWIAATNPIVRWCLVFSDVESCHLWRTLLTDPFYNRVIGAHDRAPLRYARTGAWIKPDAMPQMSGDRPAVGFEPCTIAHAHGPMRWNGGGKPATWTHGICKTDRPDHPCPKPESLMLELVSLFTDTGETILDPFAGSGTTLVAAKRLARKAIGIELDEAFIEVAAKRCSQGALTEMFA